MSDSRQFVPELLAGLESDEGGRKSVIAPAPGLWSNAPQVGALVRPGLEIGALDQLGVVTRLRAPEGAIGVVVERAGEASGLARRPVEFGEALLVLDPDALGESWREGAAAGVAAAAEADGTVVFRTPSSGRFYRRPAPDKPTFVDEGQEISRGQTIGLLEVMKTFTRVTYDDPTLPERARIVAVAVEDQADVDGGQVLLRLEPVS